MMKAAVVTSFDKPLEIQQVPIPKIEAGKILVKIVATGVCHTDLHAARGDWPVQPSPPFIPGHEGAGVVVQVADDVVHVQNGDRVGIPWLHTACGHCKYCYSGWETLCGEQQNTGYSVNGTFAEYVLADAAFVAKLPDQLGFEEAAPILCAGVTVYKGLIETEAKPGQTVAISGIGGLGHLAVQYAVAMGLRVVAVDISDVKLKLAKELGAFLTINALKEDPIATMQAQGGADGVLVTAVNTKAFEQAYGMLAKKGTMALCGLPPGDFPLPVFNTVVNRKTIRGSIVGTRKDLEEALHFAARGQVKSHFVVDTIENINEIFDRMLMGKIEARVVLLI